MRNAITALLDTCLIPECQELIDAGICEGTTLECTGEHTYDIYFPGAVRGRLTTDDYNCILNIEMLSPQRNARSCYSQDADTLQKLLMPYVGTALNNETERMSSM